MLYNAMMMADILESKSVEVALQHGCRYDGSPRTAKPRRTCDWLFGTRITLGWPAICSASKRRSHSLSWRSVNRTKTFSTGNNALMPFLFKHYSAYLGNSILLIMETSFFPAGSFKKWFGYYQVVQSAGLCFYRLYCSWMDHGGFGNGGICRDTMGSDCREHS